MALEQNTLLKLEGNVSNIELTSAQKLAEQKAQQQLQVEAFFTEVNSYDWNKLPPPIVAKLLTYKPWKSGDIDYYMNYAEALMIALRCNKLGVDPFSDEVFYDAKNKRLNLTLEGEIAAARAKGIEFGVPTFKHESRPFTGTAIPGFKEDLGCICTMLVKTTFGEQKASAEVWLSEGWYVATNPNWRQRTKWMLEVRAQSNAIKNCSGVGISAQISEQELPAASSLEPTSEIVINVSKQQGFKPPEA
jgi:hypothetical protein